MNYLNYKIIYIFISLNLIKFCISETFLSYFKNIENVDIEEESAQCISVYNLFKDCILRRNQNSIIDFNDICETFNNGTCQTIQKSMDKTLSKCSKPIQNKLIDIINEDYSILSFYCYVDSDNEYCPISKLFQKYATLNEEITVEHFNNTNFLNDLCKTKSCYNYIQNSYKAMQLLNDIGIIKNIDILETESDISLYLKSEDCQNYLIYNIGYQQFQASFIEYIPENDYLNIINTVEKSTKILACKTTIKGLINCLIDYRDSDSLPDYNKYCDTFNSQNCREILNDAQSKIKECEKDNQTILSNAITSANDISNLFCYRSKNGEFCPISKIFQKSKTVKKDISSSEFYNLNLLQSYCLDNSCSQYIDESYIGIYDLYNIGLIHEDSVMSSLKYIRDYINSPDCNRIRSNYGKNESQEKSYSVKQYIFSLYLIFITIIVSYNFLH
ncbi:hypothetical protein BCR36DRAFT_340986 [Piromyces finnis]|uniref:Transmembrane protein n=1 Tax=Piromyces finnis TaxID=1754191 RepID=A0A1Y1VNF9_9FUNG|nr:hypothetical protein BCR36DRAFT_340986 [Piromyces finnis]|eukprot:ORX60939.1 hypothetical protein BCR36DRAFT_340986 [Piromyces finnis]